MKPARLLLACALTALACAPLIGLEEAEEIAPDAGKGGAEEGGVDCPLPCELPNATARCEQGSCRLAECNLGWQDCDTGELNHEATGCETNIASDPRHCGVCGQNCADIDPERNWSCKAGVCVPSGCPKGQADCDEDNFCETNLESVDDCGFCGNVCPVPTDGAAGCKDGVCGFICAAPLDLCFASCVDLQSNNAHCGACGSSCTGGRVCTGGVCRCPAGTTECGATCADLAISREHCGACGNDCRSHPNVALASCSAGKCKYTCRSDWADCTTALGCETSTTTSANCGSCGAACTGGMQCTSTKRCRCPTGTFDCSGVCRQCCTNGQCSGGKTCQAGVCACPAATKLCGAVCQQCCADPDCGTGSACCSGTCTAGACP
jgi:hypothetical protein